MTPHHFRRHALGDILEAELLARSVRGDVGVEDHLVEHVAELLDEVVARAGLDRIHELVGLLDEVLHERGVGLLLVPGAASRRPQPVQHGDEFLEFRMRVLVDHCSILPPARSLSLSGYSTRALRRSATVIPEPLVP